MKSKEARNLKHGLYRIYWTEEAGGGSSVAAVGSDHEGRRWMAPTNWTSKKNKGSPKIATTKHWKLVESVELITTT